MLEMRKRISAAQIQERRWLKMLVMDLKHMLVNKDIIDTINLLERMTRLRMLPTRPSEETKEDRTPMIQNLK